MRLNVFLLPAFIILSLAVNAQQLHFIYIQADNKQPFSVALNNKYYSSSSTGYIILPKLTDGTYKLAVNFAKNSYPEQTFSLTITGKDYGYALKNFDTKGWGLFNFQTTDIVMNNMAASAGTVTSEAATTTNTSAFGNMLADVVNDKSINTLSNADTVTTIGKNNQATAISSGQPVTPTAAPDNASTAIVHQDSDMVKAAGNSHEMTADTLADVTDGFNTTGIIKAAENAGEKGTDLTFIDFSGTHNDTIKAFIPAEAIKLSEHPATFIDSAKSKVNNPFFAQQNKNDSTAATVKPKLMEDTQPAAPAGNAIVNAACTNMVSEGDLNRLKKRIIAQTEQEAILLTVKKSLKNKCITTTQVKDLSNLFLNDDSRYGFYDAIYPFVYDFGNYASLESTLIASYYKTRFKALLH